MFMQPQSYQLAKSYTDDFTDFYFNSKISQMTEILTDHASSVETWEDEREVTISAPKSTITLFTHET